MSDFDLYGTWSKMRRCLLLDDGTVNYYLDPNDSTKKEDNSPANLDGSDGQVMVEIPKFWYKKEVIGDDIELEVSDEPKDGLVVHPAFYRDRNGDGIAEEVDYRYYGAYMGYNDGGKLSSVSDVTPTVSQTIGTFRNQAEARGNGWGIVDYYLLYAIQLLYITEYGHPDSQTTIGRGYVDGNSSSTQTGGTNQYGNYTFGETTGTQQMSYRGIEDFWGNTYYWIDGIVTDSSYNVLIGNKNFNDNGSGYEQYTTGISSYTNGYISNIHDNQDLGFIIKEGDGNDSSKLYDYGFLYVSRVARFGGYWANASNAGAFHLQLNSPASDSYSSVAARLAF